MKKFFAILLTVAMLCSMLPIFASAEEIKKSDDMEISKKSEAIIEADIWNKIDAFEDDNIIGTRDDPVDTTDYAELSDEIESLVKQSETYVEGTVVRNGDFFTWETTEGIVCGYSPELRAEAPLRLHSLQRLSLQRYDQTPHIAVELRSSDSRLSLPLYGRQ